MSDEQPENAVKRSPRSTGRMRSSSPLFGAALLEALVPLLRNIVLARLISPEDFGLAISLSIVLGMIEVITDFGIPIFAVRKPTSVPAAETMMTLQSLALIRCTILAMALVLGSPLIAKAFHAPDETSYALLGLIAFLRGFENLGVKEKMQDFIFWREAVVSAISQLVLVTVTIATAAVFGGYECMIWGMLASTLVVVILSNLLSPRRFRLGWNSTAAREATNFGGPLLVNGVAVSLSFGDRVLVGSILGPAALAFYNITIGTATLPRAVLARFLTSFFVPLFSRTREDGSRECTLSDSWAWSLSLFAFIYGWGLGVFGDIVLSFIFGSVYQPSRLFITLVGLSLYIEFMMFLPIPSAYALGRTSLISMGSTVSVLAILPAALCIALSPNLSLFLFVLAGAEFLALLWFIRRACRVQRFSQPLIWRLIAIPVALLSGLAAVALMYPDLPFLVWLSTALAFLLAGSILYRLVMAHGSIDLVMLTE